MRQSTPTHGLPATPADPAPTSYPVHSHPASHPPTDRPTDPFHFRAPQEEVLSLLKQIKAKVGTGGGGGGGGAGGADEDEVSPKVEAFEAFIAAEVKPFVAVCKTLGSYADELGQATEGAFTGMRDFIDMATKSKKPKDQVAITTTAPWKAMGESCKKISAIKDNFKNRDFVNHARAAAEGINMSVQWLVIPGPAQYLQGSSVEGADFWLNKVRKDFRNSDKAGAKDHVAFANAMAKMLKALVAYVKENYKMGLDWNFNGKDASEYSSGGGAAAAAAAAPSAPKAAAGGLPPPPPPSGLLFTGEAKPKKSGGGGGMGSVFAQLKKIDQSGGKTAGLKHVTKDMKAKNMKDKPKLAPKPKKVVKPAKKWGSGAGASKVKKAPVKALQQGKKWVVENYEEGVVTISADECKVKHTVYIYNCGKCAVVVEGKVNAIIVDSCKKTQVKFKSTLASCEAVNCKSIKIQVDEKCATVSIDKTDGVVVYLSRTAMKETTIVQAKSSEMNVSFPGETDEDAWVEMPIPEQFQHKIVDMKVTSEVSELYQ